MLEGMTETRMTDAEKVLAYRTGRCDLCGALGQGFLCYTEVHYEAPSIEPRAVPGRVFWIDAYCEKCGKHSGLLQGKSVIRIVPLILHGEAPPPASA